MKRTLLVTVAVTVLLGALAPEATARLDSRVGTTKAKGHGPATAKDYMALARALEGVRTSLDELKTALASSEPWQPECRGYSPEKTVRCAAVKFQPEGGAAKAISVWSCESGFGTESPHTDAYHGPFQFTYSTYDSQQESMPDVVEWYDLSAAVHDMRSNILTAVAWASRHGWGPWSCA